MKVKITFQKHNPLLKRTEVMFEVEHGEKGGTPRRSDVRQRLAKVLKKEPELVYVKRMETRTGTMTAMGEANVYDSVEQARIVEPEHILVRNTPKEKPKEEG